MKLLYPYPQVSAESAPAMVLMALGTSARAAYLGTRVAGLLRPTAVAATSVRPNRGWVRTPAFALLATAAFLAWSIVTATPPTRGRSGPPINRR